MLGSLQGEEIAGRTDLKGGADMKVAMNAYGASATGGLEQDGDLISIWRCGGIA